jgi:hypothetical protein
MVGEEGSPLSKIILPLVGKSVFWHNNAQLTPWVRKVLLELLQAARSGLREAQ